MCILHPLSCRFHLHEMSFSIPSLSYLFIFFGCVGSSLLPAGFSLVAASGGYSLLWCTGFSLWWLLLLQSMGSRHAGFSSCGTGAQQLWLAGCRVQAQQLQRTGLVALWHVGSSQTRDRIHVPCIGRQTPNHCTTREAPYLFTFNLCVSFALKWVSCRQHIVGSCFITQSATLCLLIIVFSPLTFKVIIRHRHRGQMYGYQGGKGWGRRNWETGIDTYTLLILCIKQTTDGNILYSTVELYRNALW